MTHKERMLRAARGEWADRLPFAPRLDLWYNANVVRGTLPPRYRHGQTTRDIADDLGVGYHAVVPEFMHVRSADDKTDRALGIYRLWGFAYKAELTSVERVIRREGDTMHVEYRTPVGTVTSTLSYTEEMRQAGASVAWIDEPVIKTVADYKVVGHIFRHIELTPDYDNYRQYQEKVGDRGFAVAYGMGSASPMHHVMKDLAEGTQFYYELADHPKELQQLCEDMTPFYERLVHILADSPAEVVLMGANHDDTITYPPLYREHIMPWLQRWADILHAKGKLLLTHCDGENEGLLDLLAESGFDIAESVCAPPMVRCSMGDMRRAFGGRMTIFGGVPSVALLEESMDEEAFEAYMRGLFREIAPGDRFILGVSDMVPPDAKWERLVRIAEMVEAWGRLPFGDGDETEDRRWTRSD
jgi:uroporphyrinogen-III decarboxylase